MQWGEVNSGATICDSREYVPLVAVATLVGLLVHLAIQQRFL